jgi:transcription initiation factor TFIID subunit 6
MGCIPTSVIKNYAEAAGYANLDEESLLVLSRDCEYKIRLLIQEARKFMSHSRRTKLTVEDLNFALDQFGEQPLLGYDGLEALQFKPVQAGQAGLSTSSLPSAGMVWVVPGEEVSLEDVLAEPLPKAPQPITLSGHWLAIEGVQPQIPENPSINDKIKMGLVPSTSAIGGDGGEAVEKLMAEGAMPVNVFGPLPRKTVVEEAEVKPLVKHVLSKEHQLYFDTITNDLSSTNEAKVEAAIAALGRDAGLQQLVPYFIQFIAELVPKSLRDSSRLLVLIRMLKSLFFNEHLLLEPYLHQMMPPILTCIVGKRLCDDVEKDQRHWRLREEASNLLASILSRYSSVYQSLMPRVVKSLTKGLLGTLPDDPPALTSQFGSILAFSLIDPHCVETIVLPHAQRIYEDAVKAGGTCGNAVITALLERCQFPPPTS